MHTTKRNLMCPMRAMAMLLIVLFAAPHASLADTVTVENNISVKNSGDGTSEASVRTEIDGQVVEDISLSEDGTIRTRTTIGIGSTNIYAGTASNGTQEEMLRSLIERLTLLIQYYATLLSLTTK